MCLDTFDWHHNCMTKVLELQDNAILAVPQAFGKLKKLVRINLADNEIKDKQMLRVVRDATTQVCPCIGEPVNW